MRPELPFLAAGAVTIAGAAKKEGHWPKNGARSIVGTVALVVVASATEDTPLAPLVHAMGSLVLLVACIAAININRTK
jgi:peptidoglycan/LPS O-acetylase OafA/YrhL